MPQTPNTSASDIYLVGPAVEKIHFNRLPTIQQVLQLFFFIHKSSNAPIREKAALVATEVLHVWEKTGIPTCCVRSVVGRITNLHNEWIKVAKNKDRAGSAAQQDKERQFQNKISGLFDISNTKNIESLSSPEIIFLEGQRRGCRRGLIRQTLEDHNESTERRAEEEFSIADGSGEDRKYKQYYLDFMVLYCIYYLILPYNRYYKTP